MNIVVPQLGESVIEARVARWLKKQGDQVAAGDPLVELETDKIDLEVNAESAGVLSRIDRQDGEDVKVGDVLGVLEAGSSAASAASAPRGAEGAVPPASAASAPRDAEAAVPPASAASAPRGAEGAAPPASAAPAGDLRATATARRMAADQGIDLAGITGTGEGGRITKEDVQKAVDAQSAGARATPADTAAPSGEEAAPSGEGAAPASAVATNLAEPGPTRVAADQKVGPAPPTQPTAPDLKVGPTGPAPDLKVGPTYTAQPARTSSDVDRPVERVRMTKRRATIARRLVEAQHAAAMLTTFNEVDMTAVQALRARRKESFQKRHGVSLGLSSFFVKAAVAALKAFPRINAEVQGDEMVLKRYYDIGIAVGASSGLVVPVLRDADRMTFWEIEAGIKDYAKRAEDGALTLEEIKGGTFTITNGGVFGSLLSTPILNPPQVGILGLHKIEDRPVAAGGQVVVRPMMYVALSYDHRIVDGLEAVQFLVRLKEFVEDPGQLLIES